MKVSLRVLLVFTSVFIAYFVAMYAASFTGAPLVVAGKVGKEGTPVTEVVVLVVFSAILIGTLVIGNALINRYFRDSPK